MAAIASTETPALAARPPSVSPGADRVVALRRGRGAWRSRRGRGGGAVARRGRGGGGAARGGRTSPAFCSAA